MFNWYFNGMSPAWRSSMQLTDVAAFTLGATPSSHAMMPFVCAFWWCNAWEICLILCKQRDKSYPTNTPWGVYSRLWQNLKHISHASQIKTKKTKGMGWWGSAQSLGIQRWGVFSKRTSMQFLHYWIYLLTNYRQKYEYSDVQESWYTFLTIIFHFIWIVNPMQSDTVQSLQNKVKILFVPFCHLFELAALRKKSSQNGFWDCRGWKSGVSIVIWDCGRWAALM